MIVTHPWNHSSLLQQILANLRPSDRTGFAVIDLLISPRQEALIREQVNIFNALEAGETIERELPDEERG